MGNEGLPNEQRARRESRLARRMVTLPALFLAFALVTATFPALLASAIAIDAVRSLRRPVRGAATRLTAFLWCYLAAEVVGVASLFAIWILSAAGLRRAYLVDATYAVQRRWAGSLFAIAQWLFALRFVVENDACAARGPVLVFIRHASLVDTLVPTVFVTGRHGIRLRFVLKRELLVDPCLDIAGLRLPNCFVARDGKETDAELDRVRALGASLSDREGCLIFPEGTRFTAGKQRRALERIAASDPVRHARVRELTRVMPPRTGGALALLESSPGVDVVFISHHGLDGFAEWHDIWRGGLVGREVRVKMWRVERARVPENRDERIAWLDREWAEVDAYVRAFDASGDAAIVAHEAVR